MTHMKGIPGAPGIARGPVVYYKKDVSGAKRLSLNEAREHCLNRVRQLYQKTKDSLGEEQAKIFSAYEMLLEDEMLFLPIQEAIDRGTDEIQAILNICGQMSSILREKGGEYLRQRADDIRYIGEMLAEAVKGGRADYVLPEGGAPFLLAARELTPVDTMQFDTERLLGLVTQLGGATSHTVILAKSLGIPAVVGVSGVMDCEGENGEAFLDGYTGEFVIGPDDAHLERLEKRMAEEAQLQTMLSSVQAKHAETADGERIYVSVNVGSPLDLKDADGIQFDGVGLFRSEFLYSSEREKPSFEKQKAAYQKVIDRVEPNPVIIRTLDVGGDKQLPYLHMPEEENPFLGNRGIRLCLRNREIFREQLEAILAAAAGRRIDIMLPMVTSFHEIGEAKKILKEAEQSLRDRGILFGTGVRLGIMIETPASTILAKEYAKYCDFFSIGTNDLTQYLLAADRGNAAVENIYNPFHPAVIRMLSETIWAGRDAGIEVSVCGDLAADLRFTKLLLGLGLKKFSVPLPMVCRIKYKIGTLDLAKAEEFAAAILVLEDEVEIRRMLEKE